MLKKFFKIKLNPLCKKILGFWENDFNSYLDEHYDYLNKNLENQEMYNSKFSEYELSEMYQRNVMKRTYQHFELV